MGRRDPRPVKKSYQTWEAYNETLEDWKRRNGGFNKPSYGYDEDSNPVTFSTGYGSKEGETLIADGHIEKSDKHPNGLRNHGNHNHYGSGNGRNNNVKDRGKYSGPGA